MTATESTEAQTRELDKMPTWAVAGVAAVMIIISIVLEKIRCCKGEKETPSPDYEFSNVGFMCHHGIKLGYLVMGRSCKGCFFQQFFKSVSKADYLTLRNGFIAVHLAPESKFNFQKYIKRSLEDNFKLVVGVSPVLWGPLVVYLLLNVKGWQALFWAPPVPVIARNFVRMGIPRRGWDRLCLVLFLLFLLAHSAWGEQYGGEPGDGGSASAKGGVSGGPPGGETDVGSAPSPPMLRR